MLPICRPAVLAMFLTKRSVAVSRPEVRACVSRLLVGFLLGDLVGLLLLGRGAALLGALGQDLVGGLAVFRLLVVAIDRASS